MPKTSSTSVSSQIAHTQKLRRKQIEKLKQLKLTVLEIHRDVQYRVDFLLRKENIVYSIVIDLPPAFPSEAPVLFIHPPCSHKYLDAAQLVVNFPPLENFKNRPDLSFVIKRLMSEFEKNPPVGLLLQYPSYQTEYQVPEEDFSMQEYLSQYPKLEDLPSTFSQSDPSPSSSSKAPEIEENIPELDDLSAEELKDLLADEVQLLGVYHKTEMSKKLQKDRNEISENIEKIANENLSQTLRVEQSRENLMKSFEKCQKLREKYDKNTEMYMEATEWLSLNNLSLTLQVSAAEQEEKAERMAEKFVEGELDVAEFTKEFVKTKALATARKVQEDKIHHMIASS